MKLNENCFASFIVPIYNSEKWLAECVESILAQTIEDFEVILIDDGSRDKSGLICDWFKEKDDRICVVHKENGGVSSARNKAIRLAKGEFVFLSILMMLYIQDCWSISKRHMKT